MTVAAAVGQDWDEKMLLTITTTHKPATDLGYLLHKNPARCQRIQLSFGDAFIFYPEAHEDRCTVAILLDVDPIGLVRGKSHRSSSMPLEQYVNDRPYVCSSFLSVALGEAFGTAMGGRCSARPELASAPMPLLARLSCLPCRGGERLLRALFEPLGYTVNVGRIPLDAHFSQWGDSQYFTVELAKEETLAELLNHLYVLIPVMDGQKHYYIDTAELEKLLRRGDGWLGSHPERETIARRYLKYKASYARDPLCQYP